MVARGISEGVKHPDGMTYTRAESIMCALDGGQPVSCYDDDLDCGRVQVMVHWRVVSISLCRAQHVVDW